MVGMALSPDGLQLASATECGTLGLLDPRAQRYSTLLRAHSGDVGGVAVVGDSSPMCFVTASADGTARLWDAASGRQTLELYSPAEGVECVAAAPDGTQVACGFGSGTVRVFDVDGAALVAESRQHGASVLALAYGQRGRTLFSLGADGAVWAYDAARAHVPAKLLCAGAPLRATCMAICADGRALVLAAAAPLSGSVSRKDGRAREQAIQLYSTAALELLAQLPVHGPAGAVTHLALLPGRQRRVVLAATADGRLQGYSSASGQLVLDVARAHRGGCQAVAVDDSGTFLATASSSGGIRVWGLHALHQLPPEGGSADADAKASPLAGPAGVLRSLPCQLLTGHPGAVRGLAFVAGGLQLVSTGTQGVVCSWCFHGKPCNADTSAPDNLTSVVVLASSVPLDQQQHQLTEHGSSEERQERLTCPTFNLTADCRAAATLGAPPTDQAASTAFFPPHLASSSPRTLPAALQPGSHQRPPSAPAVLVEPSQTHAAGTRMRPSSSLPTSPQRAHETRKEQPLGSSIQDKQQRMVITTDCKGERQVQGVRQERALVISSPSAGKQRSVHWEARDVPANVVPAYRPSSQPQLLPPHAALGHVLGFTATAGFEWWHSSRSVVLAAGSMMLMERLGHDGRQGWQQQLVAQLPGPVTAMASAPDGTLLASAIAPSCSGGGSSDILLHEPCGAHCATLRFHSYAVQELSFSPDGAWLASVSGSPEPGLALWNARAGELVAAAPLQAPLHALAWLPGADAGAPVFYTAAGGALARWALGSDDLSCVTVNLGRALAGQAPLTALCCPPAAAVDCPGCPAVVLAGDARGRIWQLALDGEQELSSYRALAEVEGGSISFLASAPGLIAAGTAAGSLLLLLRDSASEGGWKVAGCCQLDGAVLRVQADAGAQSAVASTATGTLWQASFHDSGRERHPRVLLCGQQHMAAAWAYSAGAGWRKGLALLATASPNAVAIWCAVRDWVAEG